MPGLARRRMQLARRVDDLRYLGGPAQVALYYCGSCRRRSRPAYLLSASWSWSGREARVGGKRDFVQETADKSRPVLALLGPGEVVGEMRRGGGGGGDAHTHAPHPNQPGRLGGRLPGEGQPRSRFLSQTQHDVARQRRTYHRPRCRHLRSARSLEAGIAAFGHIHLADGEQRRRPGCRGALRGGLALALRKVAGPDRAGHRSLGRGDRACR